MSTLAFDTAMRSPDHGTTATSDDDGGLLAAWARALWAEAPPAAAPHDASTVGVDGSLGGVRLADRIGAGGMGTVFRGRHEMLDIDVAVKVMKDVADPERFLKEARLAARAQHARIVRVLHAGRERGRLFLVMELLAGANLKQILARHGALPWAAAARAAGDAAAGLGAAHRLGIVHRDVKPSNLIVGLDGRTRVADLGLAREARGDDDRTDTGIIVGTPAYMAPEQARDSSTAGPRADVYALGATLFHLLAGEPPFKRSSQTSVLLAHLNEPPPDPRSFARDVPEPLAALVTRMLAKDPQARPADGDAVARELAALDGGSTPATARFASGQRARRPAWMAAASLAGVAALVVVGRIAPPRTALATADAEPRVAAAARLVAAADDWQTPERACFAIDDELPEDLRVQLGAALAATGLRVVERAALTAISAEHDLAARGRLDPATAVPLGRLVGGQVAVVATPSGARLHLRAVPIETGEIGGDRLIEPAALPAAVDELVRAALALVPAQGRLSADAGGAWLSLGRRHGLRVGDRVEALDEAGARRGLGVVTAVEATRSRVRLDDGCAADGRARRIDAP